MRIYENNRDKKRRGGKTVVPVGSMILIKRNRNRHAKRHETESNQTTYPVSPRASTAENPAGKRPPGLAFQPWPGMRLKKKGGKRKNGAIPPVFIIASQSSRNSIVFSIVNDAADCKKTGGEEREKLVEQFVPVSGERGSFSSVSTQRERFTRGQANMRKVEKYVGER